jgi:hypothetical protein
MTKAILLLAVLLPASAAAQGLGDAAAREREKRGEKKASSPAKVFTDADLTKAETSDEDTSFEEAGISPGDEGLGLPPGSSKSLDSLDKEREERKLQEAEWRIRFANAREQVALAEAACWQEVVRTQFYNGIPVQMKVKEFVESQELRRAKAALADLEEEFRRTGLPPGWARK